MNRVVVLLVAASALVALKHSDGPTPNHPAASAAGSAAAAGADAITSSVLRVSHGVGSATSYVIRPGVRSMTENTARMLAELDPAIRKTPAHRAARARAISKQIVATDSAALGSLNDGRPIRAMRLALKSRSLVDAVRHQVAEEAMFR
jgi:hypothetical protein